MIRDIRRKYFEIWANEEAQNVFLKGVLAVFVLLFVIQFGVLCVIGLRKPVLIAIGQTETQILTLTPPPEELLALELKRLVRHYTETHYTWDSTSVEKAHEEATRYVGDAFIKAFKAANAEQIKIAKEKKLSQKVYVSDISIDSKTLTARITLDRILIIEGLRATSPLVLDITFEYGPRTQTNPVGIYITAEKVVNS